MKHYSKPYFSPRCEEFEVGGVDVLQTSLPHFYDGGDPFASDPEMSPTQEHDEF